MQRITIRIPDRLLAAIEERAAIEHRDLSKQIRMTLSREYNIPNTEDLDKATNPELALS